MCVLQPSVAPLKTMLRAPFSAALSRIAARWPLLTYAATWTALLTLTVAVASFAPEVAFVSAISSSSSFARSCNPDVSIRVPLDVPAEILCLPAHKFIKSKIDLIVPPIFAAVTVTCSALIVRMFALWEPDSTR